MRLHLWRDQADNGGKFGSKDGVTFSLGVRVELTEEEAALAFKYVNLNGYLPTELGVGMRGGKELPDFEDLLNGVSFEYNNLDLLLKKEVALKELCSTIKSNLNVCKAYGGGLQTIEF